MIVRKHLILAVVILIAGLCLSCGEDKGTGPDGGSLFKVELERYFSSHDDDTSQVPIQRVPCSNASNDSSAYGLDVSGEWIMVALDIPETGKYKPHMNYASSPGSLISLKLEMSGCGTSTTSNFLLTEGSGIG